jgi:glycosyltransferase involved in cell wall biosynthesis
MTGESHAGRLRVAITAYDDDKAVSGPVSWVTRIPALLRDRGIDVCVLLLHWGCGENGRAWRALQRQGVTCVTQRFSSTEENTTWILEQIQKNKCQVFIANHVFPALLVGGLLRRSGIPSVGIIRSDEPFYHAAIERFFNGRAQDRLSACVGVSQFLTNLARQGDNVLLRTSPSGTPDSNVSAIWQRSIRLIYTGRLEQQQKRILDTVQAIIATVRKVPGATAVLVGTGTQEAIVRQMVAESGLPIRVTGGIDPEHVRKELLQSQVHVLFSDYEGLPTAVVEAMACGVVPVCSRMRSGIPELVKDRETGFLVDRPVEELPEIVQNLSQNRGVWERMSAAAREQFKTGFSSESVADKWLLLCRQLMQDAAPMADIRLHQNDLCPWDERFRSEDSRGKQPGTGHKSSSVITLAKRVLRKLSSG